MVLCRQLIDELEFNTVVAENTKLGSWGCLFLDDQFRRAIQAGTVATLNDTLKSVVLKAYFEIGRTNQTLSGIWLINTPGTRGNAVKNAIEVIAAVKPAIVTARDNVLKFLSTD